MNSDTTEKEQFIQNHLRTKEIATLPKSSVLLDAERGLYLPKQAYELADRFAGHEISMGVLGVKHIHIKL